VNDSSTAIAATVILMTSVSSGAALAADSPPSTPAAFTASSLADLLTAAGITDSGYVAASYYHSNGYNTFHQFDVQHDTFQLDQAALTVAYQPKAGFGALVNVAAGEDMKILNVAEGNNANTFDIVQGFVQYAGGPMTVIAGKFVSLAGAEVIAPVGNTNFSRSFLFWAEPLTHTGIRATFAASDTLSLIAGVNNGWNTTSTSYGSKTAELGLAYTPNKTFALTAQSYIGKDPQYDAEKIFVDLVGTYNATDALSFVLNYDWGQQEQSNGLPNLDWNGLAAYVNYTLSDKWRVSVRAEYLDDKDGFFTGTPQTLKDGTVTFGYDPIKSFELRVEVRYDWSNESTFVRSISGATNAADIFANSQTEFSLQGVYKF